MANPPSSDGPSKAPAVGQEPRRADTATGGPPTLGTPPRASAPAPVRAASELAEQLAGRFAEQMGKALGVDADGSETSLAFVDHYLSLARTEDRPPILSLLAAGAGAYFGKVVADNLGGTWIGDGKTPRRLRLLSNHQFIYFSPTDQALEAIVGAPLEPGDPRVPTEDPEFDSAFRLEPPPPEDPSTEEPKPIARLREDAAWMRERLGELAPVPDDQYVSLTCRFETLQLMILELLATKHQSEGRSPAELGVKAYLANARDLIVHAADLARPIRRASGELVEPELTTSA